MGLSCEFCLTFWVFAGKLLTRGEPCSDYDIYGLMKEEKEKTALQSVGSGLEGLTVADN